MIVVSSSNNPLYPVISPDDIYDVSGKFSTIPNLRIIYQTNSIPLQKWNQFVIIYNTSIIDIFINGKLKKSNISVYPTLPNNIYNPDVPQIISLNAGYMNGIQGSICNVIYYDKQIHLSDVNRLYESVKDNDPPIFYPSLL
jgi:hypothetical protein